MKKSNPNASYLNVKVGDYVFIDDGNYGRVTRELDRRSMTIQIYDQVDDKHWSVDIGHVIAVAKPKLGVNIFEIDMERLGDRLNR